MKKISRENEQLKTTTCMLWLRLHKQSSSKRQEFMQSRRTPVDQDDLVNACSQPGRASSFATDYLYFHGE